MVRVPFVGLETGVVLMVIGSPFGSLSLSVRFPEIGLSSIPIPASSVANGGSFSVPFRSG